MITANTPDRIKELGQTIAEASLELERTYSELQREADLQLAFASHAFITEHAKNGPVWHAYAQAHEALCKAAIAASNIREQASRATTLRSKCTWWGGELRGQEKQDLTLVCNGADKHGPLCFELPVVPLEGFDLSTWFGGLDPEKLGKVPLNDPSSIKPGIFNLANQVGAVILVSVEAFESLPAEARRALKEVVDTRLIPLPHPIGVTPVSSVPFVGGIKLDPGVYSKGWHDAK